nr:dipeptide/oligopeptide/nickel ABC transporter ATP-binding protein [Bifidobacterium leontopitheci]
MMGKQASAEASPDRPIVLEGRGITKSFGRGHAARQVLFDVDVQVHEGECLAVIGGSGSGKSTLTRILLGLDAADSGTVLYQGSEVRRRGAVIRALRRDSGLVYQDPYQSLDPRWTVGDIVAEPLSLRRLAVGRKGPYGQVCESLARVGLDPLTFLHRYPMELSGGQAQRVAIARAIVTEPRIILADEPMSAIDVPSRLQILQTFDAIRRDSPATAIIMVSHDLGIVQHIADRILVLHEGRAVETGGTAQVLGSPRSAYTRQLIQAASL